MRRWAVRGPLIVPEKYDGASSIIQFVSTASQHAQDGHTMLVQFIQTSTADEQPTTGGYIFSTIDASSTNGFVYRHRQTDSRMSVIAISSGTPTGPTKIGTTAFAVGDAATVGMTWNGGNTSASFTMFAGINDADIVFDTPSGGIDGSGSTVFTSVNPILLGNNLALTRTFGHALARIIHWSGIRTVDEMEAVRRGAPPSLFGPVLFDYYNGEDHGLFRLGIVTRSLVTPWTPSPYFIAPKIITRGKRLRAAAGPVTHDVTIAEGSATALDTTTLPAITFNESVAEGTASAIDTPSAVNLRSIYPIADIATGGWLASAGGALYPMLDETVGSFSDFIYSPDNPTTQQFEVLLNTLPNSGLNSDHGVDLLLQAAGLNTNFDFNLVQGTTVLDSWTELVTVAQGQVVRTRNFSSAIIATITNRSDVRLRGVARA